MKTVEEILTKIESLDNLEKYYKSVAFMFHIWYIKNVADAGMLINWIQELNIKWTILLSMK